VKVESCDPLILAIAQAEIGLVVTTRKEAIELVDIQGGGLLLDVILARMIWLEFWKERLFFHLSILSTARFNKV